METAIRWSPTSTASDQRFLFVDVAGRSFKTCRVTASSGSSLTYDVLSSRSDVPSFRAFDWSSVDEALVAVGQSSGEAAVLRMNDVSQHPPLVFPARNQRYCNAVSFSTEGLLAAGLDKVRNDFCLNVWDLNQRVTPGGDANANARGSAADRQSAEPLRKFASSESITSVKFFKDQPDTLAAGVKGQYVRIYDLREGNSNPSLQFPTRYVHNLAIDWLDENYIASCYPTSDASICIWDRRAASRYPITQAMSSPDANLLSPALELKSPVQPDSSIWSLRFSRTRRGCLGMLSSAGEFKTYDIAKEYVSDEYRMSLEHTFGQDPANSPEPIYTKSVREFRKQPLLQGKDNSAGDSSRVVSFDFLNYDVSSGPGVVTLLADRTIAVSCLPPSSPCPMDLSSQGVLARGNISRGNPDIKFSTPSVGPETKASEIDKQIQNRTIPNPDRENTSNGDATQDGNDPSPNDSICHSNGEKLEKLLANGASLAVSDALAELSILRLRCQEGYLLDSEKNKSILSDNPAMQDLWDWIGRE